MGRVRRSQIKKSPIRHKICELYPEAFRPGFPRGGGEPSLIFIDMLNYIKNIGPSKASIREDNDETFEELHYIDGQENTIRTSTFGGAVNYLVSVIRSSIERCRPESMPPHKPYVVVLAIDKYKYVCPARVIVHKKRAKTTKIVNGEEVEEVETKPLIGPGEFNYPELGDVIQCSFADITKDKDHNSKVLFQFLTVNIIKRLQTLPIAHEIMFVFEGHCIDDITEILIDRLHLNGREEMEKKSLKRYQTPIGLHTIGTDYDITWLTQFNNTNGESDFLPFFYMKKIDKFIWSTEEICELWAYQTKSFYIYSRDTDIMVYSLIYKSICQGFENHEIMVMYELIHSKKESKWIFIDKLFRDIEERLGKSSGSSVTYPTLQLCIAALSAGSDYTECFDMVPHHHFINAYNNFAYIIQNLVMVQKNDGKGNKKIFKMRLNGTNYIKFVCMAYIQAKITTKLWKDVDVENESLDYDTILRKQIAKSPNNEKLWLPTKKDMLYQAYQLQYYINMLSRIGKRSVDIELQDSSMEKYGIKMDGDGRNTIVRAIDKRTDEEIKEMTLEVVGEKRKRKKPSKKTTKTAKEKKSSKKQKTVFIEIE